MATEWGEQGIGEHPDKDPEFPGQDICKMLSQREGHWSGKGRLDVEYGPTEIVPLKDVRELDDKGSYGRVCESILSIDGKEILVARKNMNLSKVPIAKIESEVDLLKDLKHRHLVTFIGSFTAGAIATIILYPFATCDLEQLLQALDEAKCVKQKNKATHLLSQLGWTVSSQKGNKWKPADIYPHLQRVCGCVCSALLYLHQQRIRHKDIKPSNILVREGSVYITDFNVSKNFQGASSSRTSGPYAGTLKYSAPECTDKPRGYLADIYSLGLVFMEIYTYILGRSRSNMDEYVKIESSLSKDTQIRHAALRILWVTIIFKGVGKGSHGMRELILRMISENEDGRPDAFEVLSELWSQSPSGDYFCEQCRKHSSCFGYKGLRDRYAQIRKKYREILKDKIKLETELEQAREELKRIRIESPSMLSPPRPSGTRNPAQSVPRPLSQASTRNSKVRPTIVRNRNGERLDLGSLSYSRNVAAKDDCLIDRLTKVKTLKLCRGHYLTDRCRVPNCGHNHAEPIDEQELEALRYLTRAEAPCKHGNDCGSSRCIYGHLCPQGPSKSKHDCNFSDEMHISDTVPVLDQESLD